MQELDENFNKIQYDFVVKMRTEGVVSLLKATTQRVLDANRKSLRALFINSNFEINISIVKRIKKNLLYTGTSTQI